MMNLNIKNRVVIVLLMFFILTSVPFSSASLIHLGNIAIPVDDEPFYEVVLPDAHLHYHILGVRYAEAEFEDPGCVIDVDLSGFDSPEPLVSFSQNVYLHVRRQILPRWVSWTIGFNEIEWGLGGGGLGTVIGPLYGWTENFTFRWIRINKSIEGIFPVHVAVVGVPPWLPPLHWFHFFFDVLLFMDWYIPFPFPFETMVNFFGGTASYNLHIHT